MDKLENSFLEVIKGLKRNKFITDKQNLQFIETYKGQNGWVIKSKPGGGYDYEIQFRYQDLSFNWLDWDNPWTDIWDVMNHYPDKFLKWVNDTYGIDLLRCSLEELIQFLIDTGMLKIKGKPSAYAYYKLRILIQAMLNILEYSEAGVSK